VIHAFRSEWVKLRRRTLLVSTYASLTALSALFTVLVFTRASNNPNRGGERFISLAELARPDGLSRGLTRAALLLGVVAFGIAASQAPSSSASARSASSSFASPGVPSSFPARPWGSSRSSRAG